MVMVVMVVMVVVGWWRCVALHGGIVRLIRYRTCS